MRMMAAALAGLFCVVGGLTLDGGHMIDLLHWSSLVVVGGIAIGGLVAMRGVRTAGRVLRSVFVRHQLDDARREELVDGIEVLERTSLVGGFVGLMGGTIGAVDAFYEPTLIGPCIHFAFASLLYSMFISVFIALPLKHQLLQEVAPDMKLTRRQAVMRTVRGFAVLLAVTAAFSVWQQPGGTLSINVSVPGLLFVLAGLVPSVLVASDSVFLSPVSESRQLWYSNALLCTGVVGLCCSLMHVFSVLDQPTLVVHGFAWALTTLVLPVAGAVLLRLRTPHESLRISGSSRHGLANVYFGFAGFAVVAMLGITLLVKFAMEAIDVVGAASPR